jgi:hypothetical protein
MEAVQGDFERVEIGGGGFDEEQDFSGGFQGSLPTVDGGDAGDDVDAGGETLADERAGDALGFVLGDGGGKDEATIGGGYGHCRVQGTGYRVQRMATDRAASVYSEWWFSGSQHLTWESAQENEKHGGRD